MRNTFQFASIVALLYCAALVQGAVRDIPPLFRENPNLRSAEVREDTHLNFRLPNNTVPVHYDVELSTQVQTGDRAFSGTVKIELNVIELTRTIVVHARQLSEFTASIKRSGVVGANEEELVVDAETDKEREFLNLTPKSATLNFEKDTTWILIIKYKGQLRTDNGGFYLSTYLDDKNVEHYLATTQFESTDARHAFPCYDEPAKRATFTITLNHNAAYSAISNMPVDVENSRTGITVFQTTPNMPTYLVAFIVSDFEYTEGILNNLAQRIYSRPGTKDEQEWALVSGMLILQRLAEYFDVPFVLPKLYQVAVPDFAAGAMENWGLATYREEYMLYNTEKSTVNTQTNVANIIAHEYAHQWFGNYVAIEWWTYLWLKESFAQLFSYISTDEAYPEWDIFQLYFVGDYQNAMSNDATITSRPMTHYVQQPNEISRLYNYVPYAKGASVLRMFQHAFTDVVFKGACNNYLEMNKYSSAVEFNFFNAYQIAALNENVPVPERFENMMSTWTHQAGLPLLTVTRNYQSGGFTVKQTAFFNDETVKQEKIFYIPFNYATASNSDFRNTTATHFLKNEPEVTVDDAKLAKNDWLILNKQSTGYYRINYDEDNWKLIIEGLIRKPQQTHTLNRAQLLQDAYRFATSDRLKHNILLELFTYLTKEDQYAPWATANSILTTFNRYLSGDKDYSEFQFYVATLVNNTYEKLGVNDIPGEHHLQKYTRSIAINLACLAGIESCLQETNNKLIDFMTKNIVVEPNLQSQTFCNGLRQSGDNEYDYVYKMLMDSADQAQRRLLISSLGCSQKKQHIDKFIASSIDNTNKLRVQERTTLLSSSYSRGEVGLLACIDFLNENWEAYGSLTSGFGRSNPLDDDIRGMSQYVVNTEQETKLLALVDKVKNSDKVTATLETGVKSNIKANFDWLGRNREPLMSWIKNFRNGSASITATYLSIFAAMFVVISRLL